MFTHTGERPEKCSQCYYSCKTTTGLKSHLKIHIDGGKPYRIYIIDASYVPFHQIIWRHTNRPIILRRCFGIFTLREVLIFSYIFLRGWREFSKEFVSVHTSIVKHISMFVLTTHPMFTDEASKDSACAHICGQIRQHGQCVQIPLDHGVHYTVSGSHQGL